MVQEHPNAEIVGICDEQESRMQASADNFGIPTEHIFTDHGACLEKTQPDFVILCPATAEHGDWTEKVAPYGVNILVEKPFAASLAEADRMIAAVEMAGKTLAINWPMRWDSSHVTAHRLLNEGRIGKLTEVHYYDGNRGPLYHLADKVEVSPSQKEKASSWFYQKDRGGGSLLDYLGYGVTLGTWYHGDNKPLEVTTVTDLAQRTRGGRAQHDYRSLRRGSLQIRNPMGNLHRPMDPSTSTQVRFCPERNQGHHFQLRQGIHNPRSNRGLSGQGQDLPADDCRKPLRIPYNISSTA